MVVTLTGANVFSLRSEFEGLIAEFIDVHGDIAVENLDVEESDFNRIRESLQSTPFLSSRKMVVLRNPSASSQFIEEAEKLLQELPETTDLLLLELQLDKRSNYHKLLKKMTDFREFIEIDQNGLIKWLIESSKVKGGSISPADASILVERIGTNQQLLSNELEKLLLYEPNITKFNIELLTDLTPQGSIFELLNAAFAGNLKRSIKLYNDQRQQRVEPTIIVSMLTRQLRILALIKTATGRSAEIIAKESKLNPYSVRMSQSAAGRISYERLKQLIVDLLTIDVRSKRETIDIDEALQFFLVKIAT